MTSLQDQIQALRQDLEDDLIDRETYKVLMRKLSEQTDQPQKDFSTGNIAEKANVAQGDGAIAAQGNVYLGDPTDDPDEALRIYRKVLLNEIRGLPLQGISLEAADARNKTRTMALSNVYIALNTKSLKSTNSENNALTYSKHRFEQELKHEPLSALDACSKNQRIILLGDPGGGKSTFVNYLAYGLAAHQLGVGNDWHKKLAGLEKNQLDLIPLIIILRDFAASLPNPLPKGKNEPENLLNTFIDEKLKKQKLEFVINPLRQALDSGQVLVLFDGLDEVTTKSQRKFVRQGVESISLTRFSSNRYLVTCRGLSYQWPIEGKSEQNNIDMFLPKESFPTFELAGFNMQQRNDFIDGWYAELAQIGKIKTEKQEDMAKQLKAAIHRPDLTQMSESPLLLTVMALAQTNKNHLPDGSAELFETTINILLWQWEQVKLKNNDTTPALRRLLAEAGRRDVDLKRILAKLAYDVHAQVLTKDSETTADIDFRQLLKALATLTPDMIRGLGWAQEVIDVMKNRAGLLIERKPDSFSFPHRTFQEYFAGVHLASLPNFAVDASNLILEGPHWRIIILLSVGYLTYVSPDRYKVEGLLNELCPIQFNPTDDSDWQKVWLAGDVIKKMGSQRIKDTTRGKELLDIVRHRMVTLLINGHLTPRERADASNVLVELGDPRSGVTTFVTRSVEFPDLSFCHVPSGTFMMGSKYNDPYADEPEKPQHKVNIPYDYWIGEYMITVAQYKAFLNLSGYNGGYFELERRNHEPENWPARSITWHDAMAFCRWLTNVLHSGDYGLQTLAEDYRVILASEPEWEKAARGGLEIKNSSKNDFSLRKNSMSFGKVYKNDLVENPMPSRIWVWGNTPLNKGANTKENSLGGPCGVGIFPSDKGPYGSFDLHGNLFEWTRSSFKSYPYILNDLEFENLGGRERKAVRGGFYDQRMDGYYGRAASRYTYFPFNWINLIGFRVIIIANSSLPINYDASNIELKQL